jgi:DNA-binding CsgD family transcriptional regulator
MSSHQNSVTSLSGEKLDSFPSRNDNLPVSEFRFEIDGREFVAVDRDSWRHGGEADTHMNDDVVGEVNVVGRGYVIVASDPAPAEPVPAEPVVVEPVVVEPGISELLSRRELQVAHLIADGRCDKEIARQLAISIYTVREHIRRIFGKLHVCRRGGIIVKLLQQNR